MLQIKMFQFSHHTHHRHHITRFPILQPGGHLQQTFEVLTLGIADVGVRVREVIVVTAIATTADASADLFVTPVFELLLVMLQQHE